MKKQIKNIILAATLFSCGNFMANNSFAGLTPFINELADSWVNETISLLSSTHKLICANVLVNDSAETQAAIAKTIESDLSLQKAIEHFQKNWELVITKYITTMQQKLEQRKSAPSQEFYKKLESKIFELFAYCTQIHYEKLYSHLADNDAELMFMFDEQGLIPAGKRTRALPNPAL